MTDGAGRTARWTAAALAAPVVAGGFAGVTAWSLHHDPRPQTAGSQAAPAPAAPQEDPALAALRDKLAAESLTLDRLSRQVAAVRAQAATLTKGGRGATTAGSSARTSAAGATRTTSSGSTGSTAAKAAAPAPAPAPATHTTTGASGTKK